MTVATTGDHNAPVNPFVKRLLDERSSHVAIIRAIQDGAAKDGRDPTDDEDKTLEERAARIEKIDKQLEFDARVTAANAKFVELIGAHYEARERRDRAYEREPEHEDTDHHETGELAQRAAYGRRFVESPEFKAYNGAGSSARVRLPGPATPEFRAAISLGDFSELPAQLWTGPAAPQTLTPFLDVLGRVQTMQAAVQYLYWGIDVPIAQLVAEGALKPEATLTPDVRAINVETYAHFKGITRQALEDIAQIQTIVQNKLLQGVARALEQGAAAELTGATDIPEVSGGDLTEAIRMGLAQIESLGFTANGVVVNPMDAAVLDMELLYSTVNGAVRSGNVWGLPVIPVPSVPSGTAFVGDFSQGVTWFDRGTTDVYLSDSHADFFLRNTLVILAEARAAFAVTEPATMAKVEATEPETRRPTTRKRADSGTSSAG